MNMQTMTSRRPSTASRSRTRMSATVLALAAGAVSASAALEPTPPAAPADAPVARRVVVSTMDTEPQIAQIGSTVGYYQFNHNGRKIEVVMSNGKVTSAKIDDNEVPVERVKLDSNSVTISDETGETVFSHEFDSSDAGVAVGSAGSTSRWSMRGGGRNAIAVGPDGDVMFRRFINAEPGAAGMPGGGEPSEPPSVMIGVQMSSVPDALCGHLGVESEKSVFISAVHEGLPADVAGLKPYDIVVGMDSAEGVSERQIRERLQSMKPGDSISLSVIHRGERKTLTVSPVAFDREAIGKAKVNAIAANRYAPSVQSFWSGGNGDVFAIAPAPPFPPTPPGTPVPPGGERRFLQIEPFGGVGNMDGLDEQIERAIEDAMRRFEMARNAAGGGAGLTPPADIDQMRQHMDRLEKMMQQMMEQQRNAVPAQPAQPATPKVPESAS